MEKDEHLNGNERLSWSCPRSVLPVARDICLGGCDSRHASKPAEGWLKIQRRRVLPRPTSDPRDSLVSTLGMAGSGMFAGFGMFVVA